MQRKKKWLNNLQKLLKIIELDLFNATLLGEAIIMIRSDHDLEGLTAEEINALHDPKNAPYLDDRLMELGSEYHHFDSNQSDGIKKFHMHVQKLITYINETNIDLTNDQLFGQFIWMEARHWPDEDSMLSDKIAYETASLLQESGADFDIETAIDHAYLITRHYA